MMSRSVCAVQAFSFVLRVAEVRCEEQRSSAHALTTYIAPLADLNGSGGWHFGVLTEHFGLQVYTQYLNHPALTLGYRLEVDGVTAVCVRPFYPRRVFIRVVLWTTQADVLIVSNPEVPVSAADFLWRATIVRCSPCPVHALRFLTSG